jgi:CPA2 family monovalent cation:H+ antiporter-2
LHTLAADLLIIIVAAVAVLLASHKLRLSAVVGFIVTGMLIGPSGLAFIERDQVEILAEIGVVLLLFTVGLEFSLAQLRQNARAFFLGGGLQVGCTVAAAYGASRLFGMTMSQALLLGFMVALSSTAVVLKAYADRQELQAPQGALVLAILLFQDFCLAPMLVLVPVLAGASAASAGNVALRLGLGILLVVAAFLVARVVTPRVLHAIVRTRVREVFLLGALGVCLGMGLWTARAGLSMALGAFLAGLLLSESEYKHQVAAEVLPFRDLFNSLFFISIGMLLDLGAVRTHGSAMLLLGLAIVVFKTGIASAVFGILGWPARIAVIGGMGLAQVGEFSFVLGAAGSQLGLLDPIIYQVFLGASIGTLLATPLLVRVAPLVSQRAPRVRLPQAVRRRLPGGVALQEAAAERRDHVVLVGYGLNGRNVSRVLRETAIPFVVVELNADLVRRAQADGVPVLFGDATRPEILEAAGLSRARMLVLAISDLTATRQTVRIARRIQPDLHVLARTRAVHEIDDLLRLGADEVIPEEFETSIEIFCRVLERYRVPPNVVRAQVQIIRDEGYGLLRRAGAGAAPALDRVADILQGTLTETYLVQAGTAAVGRSLRALDVRQRTRASVIAVVREGAPITNPAPNLELRDGDTLVLVGDHAALDAAVTLLAAPAAPADHRATT